MKDNIKGLKETLARMQKVKQEVKTKIAEQATGTIAHQIRVQAKKNAYVAPASYIVYYNGARYEYPPGTVADNIIIKRIPVEERGGLASIHLVTIRGIPKKIGNLLEFSRNTATGKPMPFMRPAFDSEYKSAEQKAYKLIQDRIDEVFNAR